MNLYGEFPGSNINFQRTEIPHITEFEDAIRKEIPNENYDLIQMVRSLYREIEILKSVIVNEKEKTNFANGKLEGYIEGRKDAKSGG